MAHRLLDALSPNNYDLMISIANELDAFTSISKLTLTTKQELNELKLHLKDLAVNSIKATSAEKELDIFSHALDKDNDLLIIKLSKPVPKGREIEVTVHATSDITPTMHGIYPAHYEEDGQEKTIISTQLESHHAREVFPCIDEPAAKATFRLILEAPSEFTCVSNMPVKSQQAKGKRQVVEFEPTPIMSTYLLAFAMGDFASDSATTKRGVSVTAYAAKQHAQHLDFALNVATRCLDFFEEYFDIEYPLPKSDMVAIPEFAAGAMENWGLVTYRETAMINDPANTSLAGRQRIAEVICHELAHQWFGNLVTMKWWDDLWLNEGFASWAATLASDALHPEWDLWSNFIADDYAHGLTLDALASSRPIRVTVESPKDINEIFDAVSYSKSPSVIRMLHDYMGPDNFRRGLQQYLKRFSYGNATTEDLWEELSKQSDVDVANFMKSWTEETGYPALLVKSQVNGELHLSQEQFLLNPQSQKTKALWPIPLLPDNPEVTESLLDAKELTMPMPTKPTKFNDGHSGFYRTAYAPDLLIQLADRLDSYSTENRMGLLDDSFELAVAGQQTTVAVLKLLGRYANAQSSYEWDIIGGSIGSIRSTLLTEADELLLSPLVESLIRDQYLRLGWSPQASETDNNALIRPIVLGLAVRFRLFDAIETVKDLYQTESIHPDIRGIVYSAVARDGDADTYETMWTNYLKATLQEEKNRWARALTQFEQTELAERSLNELKGKHVRQQDAISWLAGLLRNPHTQHVSWEWYQNNWDWIEENFAHGHMFSYFAVILGAFKSPHYTEEIREFFKDKNTEGIERSIEQSIEKIEYQAAWIERDAKSVKQYLTTLS